LRHLPRHRGGARREHQYSMRGVMICVGRGSCLINQTTSSQRPAHPLSCTLSAAISLVPPSIAAKCCLPAHPPAPLYLVRSRGREGRPFAHDEIVRVHCQLIVGVVQDEQQ